MIYQINGGGFVISSRRCWLPGVYATRAAAWYAFRFTTAELQDLAERVCNIHGEDRDITTADLQAVRKQRACPGGGTADAHGSGPCAREGVRVQIPPGVRKDGKRGGFA
jgi:hypothetical protein